MPDKDYSSTQLSRKLGAKPGAGVVVFFTVDGDWQAVRFVYRLTDRPQQREPSARRRA